MKPVASLSVDLDDRWSYLRTAGDTSWRAYPSYLEMVVPRILDTLARHRRRATIFVVGRDAESETNRGAIAALSERHEIGSHSFDHDQTMHRWPEEKINDDLARTEDAIGAATGRRPEGFRGPGYTVSAATLRVLLRRGYAYDASTLPSYLGPLARAVYFRATKLDGSDREARGELFGSFADGRRPLKPYHWTVDGGELLEMPVTTFPGMKVPIHVSYVLHLARYSPTAARLYMEGALQACRAAGVGPSLLLHPVDLLGPDDAPDLTFFPGMRTAADVKRALVDGYLRAMSSQFDVRTVGEHARAARGGSSRLLPAEFPEPLRPSAVRRVRVTTSESPTPDIAAARAARPSVSVVVPAYNEAGLLTDSLTRLHAYLCTLDDNYRWELVVVDDGSDDGTGRLADEFTEAHARVTVVHHAENEGLGGAVRTAFHRCDTEYVVMMDSDLSYSPDHIHRLLDTIVATGAAIVVASPYRPDANATGVPPSRLIMSRAANRVLAMAAGGGLTTLTGMVRAYDGEFARSLDLHASGPTVNCEILYRARERGAPVIEIPALLDWSRLQQRGQDRRPLSSVARTAASTLAIAGHFLFLRARRAAP